MGIKNAAVSVLEKARVTMNLPAVSGDYAEERITFGKVSPGQQEVSLTGITALLEGSPPSGASVELWLPKVADAGESHADFSDVDDYYFAGQVLAAPRATFAAAGSEVSYGSATWPLAAYPGGQLRGRSGGAGGEMVVSATCF